MTRRIAVFLPSLDGGGAERVTLTLGQGLVQRGYQVDLVLASAKGVFLSDFPEGLRLVDLKASRVLKALIPLGKYLVREKVDVLLSALSHSNIIALLAKTVFGLPIRIVVAEHIAVIPSLRGARTLRERMVPSLIRLLYRKADAVVAVSEGVAQELIENFGLDADKVKVIYNPISVEEILRKSQEFLDHPWFKPGEPPVVLGVGRLVEQKDFYLLIKAFARLRRKHKARLVILGEGAERAKLQELVHELGVETDVSLIGFVNNPYPFMRLAKVVALSSRWEALPTVLIEAMVLGKEIVATDCPYGPREILEDGRWGYLVPVGNEEELAKALAKALYNFRSEEEVNRMRASVEERFSLEKIVANYEEVLLGN